MTQQKPFAPSAERNKQAILEILQQELTAHDLVLEFGSGTGQHLAHFAKAMPTVQWLPSDLAEQLPGIYQWTDESQCTNILKPVEIDLRNPYLPQLKVTACYTANTFHIISWKSVEQAFLCSSTLLAKGEKFLSYGPFSMNGEHNSQGNREFDKQLRAGNSESGIRDLNELNGLAAQYGFLAARSIPMPANNQILVWVRN
jgi:hypothetical protein